MHINNDFINKYKKFIYYRIKKEGIRHKDSLDDIYSLVVERLLKTYVNYDSERGDVLHWLLYQVKSVTSHYLDKRSRSEDMMVRGKYLTLKDLNQKDTVIKVVVNETDRDMEEKKTHESTLILESSIKDKFKDILLYRVVDKLSIAEISDILGMTIDGTRKRYRRALLKLEEENVEKGISNTSTEVEV